MSSDEDQPTISHGLRSGSQSRSCDSCRQRKTRCNGSVMPGGCTSCLALGSPCTYLKPTKKRGPKNKLVEELRRKVAYLEARLRTRMSICSVCAKPVKSLSDQDKGLTEGAGLSMFASENSPASTSDEEHSPADDDFAHEELVDQFRDLSLPVREDRFYGASSSFALVNSTIAVKEKFLGRPAMQHPRRPLFWEILPWEKEEYDQRPQYIYPTSDLMNSLLALYFTNVHPILPLLHRPLFERSVAEGLHLRDTQFGSTLLVVLGIASRYSDDPRVFVEGDKSLSAGWKFVKQVEIVRKYFEPTLYDAQFYCLMAWFSGGISAPHNCWMYLGLGIRCIQHRGEYRHKSKDEKWDPTHELWKRAFWSLCLLERLTCVFTGRPSGIHPEDYDVELPLEIDDEYLEHGLPQPEGTPSIFSYFSCHVRLCEILGDALRRLYASKKAREIMGWSGAEWQERTVSELDSAMNDWMNTVPAHLRWDPERTHNVFFIQSAVLYTTYYHTQIAIHRQYMLKETALCPCLSVCTNSARSALRIANSCLRRMPSSIPFLMSPVFISGVMLLLNIFRSSQHASVVIDKRQDLAHVRTALMFLKLAERRAPPAGRLWELLQELYSLDARPPQREPSSESTVSVGSAQPVLSTFYDGHTWNSINSAPHSLPSEDPKFDLSVDQLLADTAEYDVLYCPPDYVLPDWGVSSGLPINFFDDELMSLWRAAPSFAAGSLGQWDTYKRR